MNKENVVIATISLARNTGEEDLLKASLAQLSLLSIPVFVTDGGSPPDFVQFLQALPHFTVRQVPARGLVAQVKSSLTEAANTGRPFLFYTEPDKEAFFKAGLPNMLAAMKEECHLGVTMAARSAKGFASFPAFQQMTESTINNCCTEQIGLQTDYCYGPFLLNKELVVELDDVQENIGWGWRPFVFGRAHRLGYGVNVFEGDFLCPEGQRGDDAAERLYRMKQLEQNIRGLIRSGED